MTLSLSLDPKSPESGEKMFPGSAASHGLEIR